MGLRYKKYVFNENWGVVFFEQTGMYFENTPGQVLTLEYSAYPGIGYCGSTLKYYVLTTKE